MTENNLFWIKNPNTQLSNSSTLSKKIDEKKDFISSIEKLSKQNICHICGKNEISKEHTPSKKAFNMYNLTSFRVVGHLKRFLKWKAEKQQGGRCIESLCVSCNNNSGSWYNPAYIKFTRECAKFANPENAGKYVDIQVYTYPLKVIKQAIIHLMATSQSGLFEKFPQLREFVITKEASYDISPIHIGLYLRANSGGRSTGLALNVKIKEETVAILSEFSFWPLGWILTFDKDSLKGIYNVTSWTLEHYHDKKLLKLSLPCNWAITAYPKDFRSPEELRSYQS